MERYPQQRHYNHRAGHWMRDHADHPRTEAAERFAAMVKEVDMGLDLPCLVFTGGDTFRVDDDVVTTPRRFAYEHLTGEELPDNVRLRTTCKTPKCCRVSHLKR
jgi:hypothetical protein